MRINSVMPQELTDGPSKNLEKPMLTPRNTCKTVALLSLSASLLFGIAEAQAHAQLVKSEPKANASGAAPQTIMLHFDDELVPKVSTFKVADIDGKPVAVTAVDTKDAKRLAATPAKPLAPGLYTVSWTAASTEDGHKMTGTFSFTVK